MKSVHDLTVWDKLDALSVGVLESRIPNGVGFTKEQYAERYGLQRQAARYALDRLVAAGKIKAIGRRDKKTVYDVVTPKK